MNGTNSHYNIIVNNLKRTRGASARFSPLRRHRIRPVAPQLLIGPDARLWLPTLHIRVVTQCYPRGVSARCDLVRDVVRIMLLEVVF